MKEKRPWRRWTEADDAQLRALYPSDRPLDEIASELGRTARALQFRARLHGLRRPLAVAASTHTGDPRRGKDGRMRFTAGREPWNKGRRHVAGGRSPATQFKAGQMPANTAPLGALRVADGILQRKIAMHGRTSGDRWRSVHELVWIEAFGAIPEGHIVRFREGMATTDQDQITPGRLECVSRADHMRRNSIQRLPPDLRQVMQLRGVLNRRIRTREEQR